MANEARLVALLDWIERAATLRAWQRGLTRCRSSCGQDGRAKVFERRRRYPVPNRGGWRLSQPPRSPGSSTASSRPGSLYLDVVLADEFSPLVRTP
jgi:hypothetical protein